MSVGIKNIAYHFEHSASIAELAEFADNEELLRGYMDGGHKHYTYSDCTLSEQAVAAAGQTLGEGGRAAIKLDAIIVGTSSLRFWTKYSELLSTEILMGLGIRDVPVFGTTLGGCTNCALSLRTAQALLMANDWRNVLVIETNKMPTGVPRHYMPYVSIFGDGSVSTIVTRDDPEFRVLGISHITKPVIARDGGDPVFLMNNVNGYRCVVADVLKKTGLRHDDIDVVIPNNKNIKELEKLSHIWGVPFDRVYTDNVARIGHLWSADNLINLHDCTQDTPASGKRRYLLLSQADSTYSAVLMEASKSEPTRPSTRESS